MFSFELSFKAGNELFFAERVCVLVRFGSAVGVGAGEDEALCEGGIETLVVGFGEPDEVGWTIVGGDTIEMMTIVGMESTEGELGRWG